MFLMPAEFSYHVQDMCVIPLHKLKQLKFQNTEFITWLTNGNYMCSNYSHK